jgi:hypothetical protein
MKSKCPRYLDAGLPVCLCSSVQKHTRSMGPGHISSAVSPKENKHPALLDL